MPTSWIRTFSKRAAVGVAVPPPRFPFPVRGSLECQPAPTVMCFLSSSSPRPEDGQELATVCRAPPRLSERGRRGQAWAASPSRRAHGSRPGSLWRSCCVHSIRGSLLFPAIRKFLSCVCSEAARNTMEEKFSVYGDILILLKNILYGS